MVERHLMMAHGELGKVYHRELLGLIGHVVHMRRRRDGHVDMMNLRGRHGHVVHWDGNWP